MKQWKKAFHANGHQNGGRVIIPISEKTNFKEQQLKETERHYIMVKGLVQQENITILSIDAPNTRASKFIKHLLLNLRNEIATIRVGDFSTSLAALDRLSRQN